jgi:hypothetical protein
MKSRNRNTRRNRKNRKTRRGGGLFYKKTKTYDDNKGMCKISRIGGTYDVGACDQLAKYNDYFKTGMMGEMNAKPFYPKVADPRLTMIPASKIKGTPFQYKYDEQPLNDRKKYKRYEQIGERILPKYDSTGKTVGYVLKDTPLTFEEVNNQSLEELESYINNLIEVTPEYINKLYTERGTKI